MNSIWSKLRFALPQAADRLTGLLAPSFRACLTCGSGYRGQEWGPLSALCPACRSAVPWITRIVCPVCGRPEHCPDCVRRSDAAFVCSRSAVRYDPLIREWLALYKYRGNEAIAPVLGELLLTAYAAMVREFAGRHAGFAIDALIPVPVSEERLLERGFNQAERLAAFIAGKTGIPLFETIRRSRHSGKQSFKSRADRLRDADNLFAVDADEFASMIEWLSPAGSHLSGRPYRLRLLVIDDIYTTGSTVNSCAGAIMDAYSRAGLSIRPEIYVLTLARS